MKTLPKHFAILRDEDNPLWFDFRKWVLERSDSGYDWTGNWLYIGYDGCNSDRGYNGYDFTGSVPGKVMVISLEQWNEAVNGEVEADDLLSEIDKLEAITYNARYRAGYFAAIEDVKQLLKKLGR